MKRTVVLVFVLLLLGGAARLEVGRQRATVRHKEAVLKENLYQMRSCIDQHLADKGRYPSSLRELVEQGYLRTMPRDPMTGAADWIEIPAKADDEEDLRPLNDEGGGPGIIDVHSASDEAPTNGSRYSDW